MSLKRIALQAHNPEPDADISAYGRARSTVEGKPLGADELSKIDAYWRASLYLCLGMLYLKANPLLREPLTLEHVKPGCSDIGDLMPAKPSPTSTSTG